MINAKLSRLPVIRRDPGRIGASLALLSQQIADGWNQATATRLPRLTKPKAVVIAGMGGSELPGDIIASVYKSQSTVPVISVSDYHLPAWVDRDTLVLCSSYSGGTEEALSLLKDAIKRKSQVVIIAGGGKLAQAATYHQLPAYLFQPTANPSHQPRLGVAYILMSMLHCLHKTRLLKIDQIVVNGIVKTAFLAAKKYGPDKSGSNSAWELAQKFVHRIPLFIGAEWTSGNLHTWRNQLHENAKTYAEYAMIPALNHHLLEGLRNKKFAKQMIGVFVHDQDYHPRNTARIKITEQLFRQHGLRVEQLEFRESEPLAKAIHLLAFGGYVSWYLAALNKVQPAAIPTVDFLKTALSRKK